MPLIPVIAGQGWSAYLRSVIAALSRLLALVALVLMPIGMAAAPAAAHWAAASAEAGHCSGSEQDAPGAPAMPGAECAMSCAAVAANPPPRASAKVPAARIAPAAFVAMLSGVEPGIATPPPRA